MTDPADIYRLDDLRTLHRALTAPPGTLTADDIAETIAAATRTGYEAGYEDHTRITYTDGAPYAAGE
jgi:hypothetical protein